MQQQINRTIPRKPDDFGAGREGDESPVRPDFGTLFYRAEFEWLTVAFACGIGLYFALSFEPNITSVLVIVLGLGVGARFIRPCRALIFAGVFAALGMGRAVWHSAAVEAPRLPAYERAYEVRGWIAAVEKPGNRTRWLIRVQDIDRLKPEKTPLYIRTSASGEGFRAGDMIKIRSVLSAPPGPAVAGGYDSGRAAYFKQIGGYGFSISKPERIEAERLALRQKMSRSVSKIRYGLADRIMARAPPETAGLQTALLTGIRTYIPKDQTEALRAAGLAHVLAISGLHMGLVAGSLYWLATLFLACILPLSRRLDVRKPAAIIGAIAATAYLILSGGSVATQRAYIMALIVFLAVILDRRAFSLRSVALAAAITLMFHPEALVSAGFQMSFSAVVALVVVYRYWDSIRVYSGPVSVLGKLRGNFASLSVTSFVAGTATTGIAMLHFNRLATYGFLGNLIAMPLFTFWVMPAAIAVFFALPFGLEALPLWVMGKGLIYLVAAADWVASWAGALAYVSAAPGWVVGLYGLAFTGLCLGPMIIRVAGIALMGVCLAGWTLTPQPDIRIADNGAVAFWSGQDAGTLMVDRKNRDRFGREQFIRRAGQSSAPLKTYRSGASLCDALACRVIIKGRSVSITSHPSEVPEECEMSDIVILTQREAGPVARRGCAAELIDARVLARGGAQSIYLGKDKIELRPAKSKARRNRPWG